MITKFHVDGFKSLNGFDMNLKPGLNILVGPNGSGKTNIILFFEFLSYLANGDVSEAVSRLGGVGAIFKKEGPENYGAFIEARVFGCTQELKNSSKNKRYLVYDYFFRIEISPEKDFVFFKNQSLKAGISNRFISNQEKTKAVVNWKLDLTQDIGSDNKPYYDVKHLESNLETLFFGKRSTKEELDRYLKSSGDFYTSLISQMWRIFRFSELPFESISSDFKGGETFNIIPSKIKQPEDSAGIPGIMKDGSGLATTLYALKRGLSRRSMSLRHNRYTSDSRINPRLHGKDTFAKIIENTKLANDSICDIDVSNDPFNNQISVKIVIDYGKEKAILPLSLMSDGTLKWITLITAVLTSKEIFSIEEPENYLHPWMQAEIIKIMRSAFSATGRKFIIMSTHSESLLNHAKPEEVIIVSMKNGSTRSKRVSRASQIDKLIAESGFGLGHFYVSNAIQE